MSDKMTSWEQAVEWLRKQPSQQDLVRACYYDDPLLNAAERFHGSSEWKALAALLPSGLGKVLDLGAGRGISSYAFARDGWKVTALEPDPSEIVGAGAIRALSRSSGLPIEVEEKWGERLPFSDGVFDVVYARAVLHHARDLPLFCREATRVLRPGGLFVATREHVISQKGDLPIFLEAHPLHRLYGGENAFLLNEYIHAIYSAGISLTLMLGPTASDINLYPDTKEDVANRIAAKLKVPQAWIPGGAVTMFGRLSNAPGRLYSFIGTKR